MIDLVKNKQCEKTKSCLDYTNSLESLGFVISIIKPFDLTAKKLTN